MIVARQHGVAFSFLSLLVATEAARLAEQINAQAYISSLASWTHCSSRSIKKLVEKVSNYEVVGDSKILSLVDLIKGMNIVEYPDQVQVAFDFLNSCGETQLFSENAKRCQIIEDLSKESPKMLGALAALESKEAKLDSSITSHLNKDFIYGYLHSKSVFKKADEKQVESLLQKVKDLKTILIKDGAVFTAKCSVKNAYKRATEYMTSFFW